MIGLLSLRTSWLVTAFLGKIEGYCSSVQNIVTFKRIGSILKLLLTHFLQHIGGLNLETASNRRQVSCSWGWRRTTNSWSVVLIFLLVSLDWFCLAGYFWFNGILIKVVDPYGKIFYSQTRLGKYGREFHQTWITAPEKLLSILITIFNDLPLSRAIQAWDKS